MKVQPYLYFDGSCEEAIEFYKSALGAEVKALMRYKESPEPEMRSPATDEKVMHSCIRIGDAEIMMSDGRCTGKRNFQGFSLTLTVKEIAEAERLFGILAEGGQVQKAMMETFWSPRFGMVADRFGMSWMVMVQGPY